MSDVCERVSHATRQAIFLAGATHGYRTFAGAMPDGGETSYQLLFVARSLQTILVEEGLGAIALPWLGNALFRLEITYSIERNKRPRATVIPATEPLAGTFYVRAAFDTAPKAPTARHKL